MDRSILRRSRAFLLAEGKAIGDYKRTKVDLRALEARAWAVVHKDRYREILRKKKAKADTTYRKEKDGYEGRLNKSVEDFKKGRLSKQQLVNRGSQEIRTNFQKAFSLGLSAQGHGALSTPVRPQGYTTPNLDTDDAKWVRSAAEEEIRYFKDLVRDLDNDVVPEDEDDAETVSDKISRSGKRHKIRRKRRAKMYADTLDGMYFAGQVRGAASNAVIHWVLGDAEHCPECIWLEMHSPYTRDTLPTTPRAGSTRCLSNCKCTLAFEYPLASKFDRVKGAQKTTRYYLGQLERSRKSPTGLPVVRSRFLREEVLSRAYYLRKRRTTNQGVPAGA